MTEIEKKEEEKLEEEIEKKIKALPVNERVKAVSLNYYLKEKKKLDNELENKMEELNNQFDDKSLPLINKSGEIIEGRALNEEELGAVSQYLTQEEKDNLVNANKALPIPDYWLKALKNCAAISEEIREKDEKVLSHLQKISFAFEKDVKTNFTITFTFSANEYFSDAELKKSFFFKEGEDLAEKTVGTEIHWKDGKNLTKKTVKKKQKNKKSGQQRVVTKEVDDDSFFLFFNSLSLEGKNLDDMDEEEAEKLQTRLDIDSTIGQVMIEEVLPYSLEYYLGVKALEGEDDGDFEDEEIDENEDEDDDDEEEDKPKPAKKGGKKK